MSKPATTPIIALASWPRSGNTLLRAILWHCFGLRSASRYPEENSLLLNDERADLVGAVHLPNRCDFEVLAQKQGVIPLKTHHKDRWISQFPSIYVVRDGREACVSYWKYWENCRAPGNDSKRLIDFINGDMQFGSWSNHVENWLQKSPRCMLLQYEGMVNDLPLAIAAISGFLDIVPIAHVLPDFEEFRESFPAFYRTGGETIWTQYFNDSLMRVFDRLHGKTMKKLGYYEATAEMESPW